MRRCYGPADPLLLVPTDAAAARHPWVVPDSAGRTGNTAIITLAVTSAADAPSARLAGFREGGAQVVVPARVDCTLELALRGLRPAPHSLVVMVEREKIPTEGGQPAFTNAMSRELIAGLPAGQPDRDHLRRRSERLVLAALRRARATRWQGSGSGSRWIAEATTASVKSEAGRWRSVSSSHASRISLFTPRPPPASVVLRAGRRAVESGVDAPYLAVPSQEDRRRKRGEAP